MFGAGKKEAKGKAGKKEAGDEIQFDFDEDDKLPFDDDDYDESFGNEDVDYVHSLGVRRQALPQRTIILFVLLLLLAGGAGYYYLNSTPAPPSAPAQHPEAAKIKVKMQTTAVPTVAPVPVAAVKPTSPVPVSAAPAKTLQPPTTVKAPAVPVVPVAKTTAPVAVAVTPSAVKSEVAFPRVLPTTHQPFTLSVGAFLGQKHQREIEKKIRRLGYTPKVQTTYSMVPMIRLLLGVYDPAAAEARQKELLAQVPDLFTLKQGDKVALYAGSYQSLDLARSFSDQLYLRGILVDEETVSLRMPLKKISYGSFPSRAAAEKAAKRAAAAGLSVQVVKR